MPVAAPVDVIAFRSALERGESATASYVKLLGLRVESFAELMARVEQGFAYRTLERFQHNTGLSASQLADLIHVPWRTLMRRRATGRLLPEESDRLLRAARIFALVLALFEGNVESACAWFVAPKTALGGHSPLALARTDLGVREVEQLVGRLEHGIPV